MKIYLPWLQKRVIYRSILLLVALFTLFYVVQYEEDMGLTWTSWSMPLSGTIIVIDPGHGGIDGGAKSKSGITEKEVVLPISFYLRDFLQQSGALVILTREDDRDLANSDERPRKIHDLKRRVEMINESSADLLISIHLNSFPASQYRGAQTFYNPIREENQRLAKLIQDELVTNLQNTDRKAKMNQDIFMLKTAEPVAALVEAGFLSNPEEAELLSTPQYQKQIAACIYRGILRYFAGEKVLDETNS